MRELKFTVADTPQQKRSATPMVVVPKSRKGQTVRCIHCQKKTPVKTFMAANSKNETNAAPFIYGVRGAGWRNEPLHTGPVAIFIYCAFPYLKSWSKKRLETAEGSPKITMPDVDRLENQLFDSLSGIVWKDDAQIFYVTAIKIYSEKPRTVVKIQLYDVGEWIGGDEKTIL